MRNIIDIYESILTKTSTRLKTVSSEVDKTIEAENIRQMAKTIDTIFCDVVLKLESINQTKLIDYLSKNAKKVSIKTDHFGQELNLGDVVTYDWQPGRSAFPWYGFIIKKEPRGKKFEYEVMESGAINPDADDPFEETCGLYRYANELIKVCDFKDALKTVQKLKKTIK
jgi:hypothetical protein